VVLQAGRCCSRARAFYNTRRRIISARNQRRLASHQVSQPVQRVSSAGDSRDPDGSAGDEPPDQFVPDPQVADELGVSLMTL
jgi:hypothetical protein